MKSRITGGPTTPLFTAKVLGQHQVTYHRCTETGFIQTDDPYWLDEAYGDAITQLDIGLLGRNLAKVDLARSILPLAVPDGDQFLDYGGGYGIFTRLMRDKGFAFLHHDPHCECLFAKGFEVEDLSGSAKAAFDCVTAWEVFEHVVDPMPVFSQLANRANSILFSTVLVPDPCPNRPSDWWYFTPETGQHVSFYTRASLEHVASKLGLHLHSDNEANHLLTHERLPSNPFKDHSITHRLFGICNRMRQRFFRQKTEPKSLSGKDYQSILASLQQDEDRRKPNE